MGKSAWPTSAEVKVLLAANASADQTTAVANYDVDAPRLELERRTGRTWLAGAAALRVFDVPEGGGTYVELGDYCVAPTLVQLTAEGATAQTLTANTDYWTVPRAVLEGTPYRGMELRRYWCVPVDGAWRRALRVTAQWGFSTDIPEDVWEAARRLGALTVLGEASALLSAGRASFSTSGGTTVYTADPYAALARECRAYVEATVRRYRQVRF